jgi:AraC-like DNA-binding protein
MEYLERYSPAWSTNSIRLITTPSPMAKSNFFYIQETGYFQTLRSYFTERSNLNSFLLVYTLSGTGKLIYLGKEYIINQGQLLFIDCMNHHFYETDSDNLWEIQWLHFNGSTSKGYYDYFASLSSPVVTLESNTQIPYLLNQILQLHQTKDLMKEILTSQYLLMIMTELIVQHHQKYDLFSMPEPIQIIQSFIEHHFSENITLDSIAHAASMSKYHLSKLFKKHTGYSPIDYLISIRIAYAKELLHFTNTSINQIAESVGIENISHFINLFKSREGMTPLSYRKLWKN